MEPVSRRSFLAKGSVGAVGAAAAVAVGLPLTGGASSAEPELTPAEVEAIKGTTLVHIKNASTGEVEVLVGEQSIKFTDKTLVAKVLRAAR